MHVGRVLLATAACLVAACDVGWEWDPSSPPEHEPEPEFREITVTGRVLWEDGAPVVSGMGPTATVEISFQGAGAPSTTTDSTGHYEMTVNFPCDAGDHLTPPDVVVQCTTGWQATGSCGTDTLQCTEGPQDHSCVFDQADCQP